MRRKAPERNGKGRAANNPMHFLANTIEGVAPAYTKDWILVAVAVLFVWEKIVSIRAKQREKTTVTVSAPSPQPFVVKEHDDFTPRHEFEQVRVKVEGLPEMERRLNENGEARAKAIHDRINPLCEAIAAVRQVQETNCALMNAVLRKRSS